MANKAISELPQAQNVNNQDLFVLEQSGIAKKLTAETFITEQGIIDALAEALDGHGGIQSVTLSSVSGRIRTYLITFTDGSATTFQVLDGTSIDRIVKTSTAGLTDTYTVFMTDGTTTFFTVTNGADGTVSEAMLNDALKDKAPAITETTESSAIANFTDGADNMVMHNVVVEINPVQSGSGDPSPDNIRPISGWTGCNVTRTGVNVWDEEWELGIYGNATGAPGPSATRIRSKNPIAVKPNTTYYLYCGDSNIGIVVHYYDENGTQISASAAKNTTITIPTNCSYIKFNSATTDLTTYGNNISINYPSSDHDYHAYQGNSVSLSWQTEAGTVYGGTIDVATGLLTVDRVLKTLVSSDTFTTLSGTGFYQFTYYSDSSVYKSAGSVSSICNRFPKISLSDRGTTSGLVSYNGDNGYRFALNSSMGITTIDEWKNYFASNPVSFTMPLLNPLVFQLTPQEVLHTLYGVNNVWADIGNVSVTYPADTKIFIEKLTMPTEDDMVANQAITSGKYFMIGNSLYLALANIASGAQITIGTNAQRVSLADALNTINS